MKREEKISGAIIVLLWAALISAVVWRANQSRGAPPSPPRSFTANERAAQAVALAGVASAANPGAAIYTPMLLAAAANIKEQDNVKQGENENE